MDYEQQITQLRRHLGRGGKIAGKYTEKLGEKLIQRLGSNYCIYYAHGRKTDDGHVCHPMPVFGNCSNASTLSYVDIVIIEHENKKVKILCEIEESRASPKKIIGDIVNILISDSIHIQEEDYEYDKLQLILGLKVTEGGKSEQKAHFLKQKLQGIIKEQYWSLLDEITIICDKDLNNLIRKVESKIMDIFKQDIV